MNKTKWYKDKAFWAKALTTAGSILMLFSPHTVAYKVGSGVTIAAGLFTWTRDKYEKDSLPSGLSKTLDKMPNGLTGIKGSKKQ